MGRVQRTGGVEPKWEGREVENQYLVTLLLELVSRRSGEGGCDDGVDVDDGCGGSSGYGNPNKCAAGMVARTIIVAIGMTAHMITTEA